MIGYSGLARQLAVARGWDPLAHLAALESGDEEAATLTHPFNWLDEEEVERETSRLMDEGSTAP